MEHLDRPKPKGFLPVVLTMEEVPQVLALHACHHGQADANGLDDQTYICDIEQAR